MHWYENVVKVCMGVQPGERVLLITDKALSAEQTLLAQTIEAIGPGELRRWTLPEDQRPLKIAPPDILECARTFDVGIQFLGHTSSAELPYRLSLIEAAEQGNRLRYGVGLDIDASMLANELMADYHEIAAITQKLQKHLQGCESIHITSPLGTDLTFSTKGRNILADTGIYRKPGYGNLPAGECFVAPLEDSANGIWVVDKSFPEIIIKEPIRLTFKQGRVVDIAGGDEAQALLKMIAEGEKQPYGSGCRAIAELGIGTNPHARITGYTITDEKVMGTIHIAIGNNAMDSYGGTNKAPIHLDGVMGRPTLKVDGRLLIDDGKYLL